MPGPALAMQSPVPSLDDQAVHLRYQTEVGEYNRDSTKSVLRTGKFVYRNGMTESVLVRNACTTPLRWVPWQRAVSAVVCDQAEIIVADEERQVRSAYLSIPFPLEIQLHAYVFVPYVGAGGESVDRATRRAILHRDKNRCGYCGGPATTIDHIFPKSRGGLDTWENLIAACLACNQRKRNRTPEEAVMPLLWPTRAAELPVRGVRSTRS